MSADTVPPKDGPVCKVIPESDKTDEKEEKKTITLCASCDRCRARKTKCDGKRPCGNCAAKYIKKHKLTRYVCSIDPFFISFFLDRWIVHTCNSFRPFSFIERNSTTALKALMKRNSKSTVSILLPSEEVPFLDVQVKLERHRRHSTEMSEITAFPWRAFVRRASRWKLYNL